MLRVRLNNLLLDLSNAVLGLEQTGLRFNRFRQPHFVPRIPLFLSPPHSSLFLLQTCHITSAKCFSPFHIWFKRTIDSSLQQVSLGWAPTPSQYCARDRSSLMSLYGRPLGSSGLAGLGIGSYVPSKSPIVSFQVHYSNSSLNSIVLRSSAMSGRKLCGGRRVTTGTVLRTEDFERLAVPCRPMFSSNVSRRKVPSGWCRVGGRWCSRERASCLPGVGDDDVVEGIVALAEARKPYLEDHDCGRLGEDNCWYHWLLPTRDTAVVSPSTISFSDRPRGNVLPVLDRDQDSGGIFLDFVHACSLCVGTEDGD